MFKKIVLAFSVAALASVAGASPITFSTSTDYSGNFTQKLGDLATVNWNSGAGADGITAGFVRATGSTAMINSGSENFHDAVEYTPTPGPPNLAVPFDSFTADLDFRVSTAGSGVGFFFGGGTSLSTKFFGQALIDATPATPVDRIKFFSGRSMTNGTNGATAAGTSIGGNDVTAISGVTEGTWYHATMTVVRTSPTLLNGTLSVTDESGNPEFSYTQTGMSDSNTAGSYLGINAFNNAGSGTVDIDNVNIVAAPEPAAMGLLLAGAVGVLFRRRRISL